MCGIAGIYNLSQKDSKTNKKIVIKKMTDKLVHRGPDDEGFFVNDKVALGHRRLSIIDLTLAGHQPMRRGDLVIVFNGEIYNYIEIREELINKGYEFKTKTDTEVILAAYEEWQEKCLDRFNGMWALAIYNLKTKDFFCARDRLGVKPFYYFKDQEKFIFASEPKALFAYPGLKALPDDQAVWDFLLCGQLDHREETIFKGIKELRGGCWLRIKDNKLKIKSFWDLPKNEVKISDQEADQTYNRLLHDSIKLRLRSDVAIGTCLSGGLDSSAIVCIVNEFLKKQGIEQLGAKQKTFSSVYDAKKFPKCDEREFIKIVTRKTKTDSNFVFPSGEKLVKDLKSLIYLQDFPFASTSIYAQYNVFRLAKSKKVKVVLDGQGSDELLAGYHTFFPLLFQSLKKNKQYIQLVKEMFYFNKNHDKSLNESFAQLFLPVNLIKSIIKRFSLKVKTPTYGSYFDYSVFNQSWRNSLKPMTFVGPNQDPFKDQSYFLTRVQGLPSLLRYEDRNSMNFSIESRTPFLDYRLVEFIYSLPDNQKIRFGQTKWVMREALKGVLPEKIRTRQDKIGFATPEEIWFKQYLAPEMKKVFASKTFGKRPYFDQKKVVESFDKFLSGEPIMYQLFWRLYNLELWLRRFCD